MKFARKVSNVAGICVNGGRIRDDFLKELGHLGLIARLKRLSDSMLYSIRDLYKIKSVDIEPNWHLVFLTLKKHKMRTMTEIA